MRFARERSDSEERVRIRADLFGHNDGILGAPLLQALADASMFALLEEGENATLEALAKHAGVPDRNLGNLAAALRGLVLLGWLTESRSNDGIDEHSIFSLTEMGRAAISFVKRGVYRELAQASGPFTLYWQYLRLPQRSWRRTIIALRWTILSIQVHLGLRPRYAKSVALRPDGDKILLGQLHRLIEKDRAGWGLDASNSLRSCSAAVKKRVVQQVRTHLEGALLASTVLALWRMDERGSMLGELLADGELDLRQRGGAYNRPLLDAAFELLRSKGFIELSGDAVVLKPKGEKYLSRAASYGVTHAYLKSFAVADELLRGKPEPWSIAKDEHLDREEDILASKGSHHPYLRNLCDHLKAQFDLPPDEQPEGIAVFGTGSGELAAREARHILESSGRGRNWRGRPLQLIAVDASAISLALTRRTFERQLGEFIRAGEINTVVLQGDMSHPAKIADDLASRNIRCNGRALGLKNLVAVQEFGPHDRGVAAKVRTREGALEEIGRGVRRSSPVALAAALKELGVSEAKIPRDADALARLIARQFTVSFSDRGRLVPAVVAGADLIEYFREWAQHAHCLIALDLHTLRTANRGEERIPDDPRALMTYQRSALAAYHWSHSLAQTIMPFHEHKLAAVLAGFSLTCKTESKDLVPSEDLPIVSIATYSRNA